MATIKVADEGDIRDGERLITEIEGREFGVFNIAGEYYALPNRCPHQGGPLCEGPVSSRLVEDKANGGGVAWEKDGEVLYCPWHQSTFHIPTGRSYGYPVDMPSYEVYVEGGDLLMDI